MGTSIPQCQRLLESAEFDNVHIDGTFTCEKGYQIITIWGEVGGQEVLLCAILVKGKTRGMYKEVFTALAARFPASKASMKSFTCDFERAMRDEFALAFDAQFGGCVFHMLDACQKKLTGPKMGLAKEQRDNVMAAIRAVICCPIPEHVPDALSRLQAMVGQRGSYSGVEAIRDASLFGHYFFDTWVNAGQQGNVAEVGDWCAAFRPLVLDSLGKWRMHLTNNSAERNHRWMKADLIAAAMQQGKGASAMREINRIAAERFLFRATYLEATDGSRFFLCGQ